MGAMTRQLSSADPSDDEAPATPVETRAVLLGRSKRTFAPIHNSFVQNPDRSLTDRQAPLAQFVRNGDLRGLNGLITDEGVAGAVTG